MLYTITPCTTRARQCAISDICGTITKLIGTTTLQRVIELRSRLGLDKLYDNNSIMEIMRISIAIGKLQ